MSSDGLIDADQSIESRVEISLQEQDHAEIEQDCPEYKEDKVEVKTMEELQEYAE